MAARDTGGPDHLRMPAGVELPPGRGPHRRDGHRGSGHRGGPLPQRAPWGEDAVSLEDRCPTCGSTGAAMVDWARYAGELEALLREARVWVKLPPHLEKQAERLVGTDRPAVPMATAS